MDVMCLARQVGAISASSVDEIKNSHLTFNLRSSHHKFGSLRDSSKTLVEIIIICDIDSLIRRCT